ncbi:electron transport complex protein RnfE [Pseudomonas reinekei]|uniref:Electron transport complex protein RnfE n=1 Tax=Pseudomonas reinekei TaxID=395598 RepID=A0A1H0RY01_PSERE|nr:Rnf-Nqr domain containing protein [Pseudomonas reinekei]KAB0487384.1 NADH:quinone oxidoreductase [Pseudomonas reinekei]OLU04785.1 NADH:quinone oxidoreductase [Pseudomonas reinekei]SDP33896.1 electron transport complex protein RnfE [Pseudomonas reinekei]
MSKSSLLPCSLMLTPLIGATTLLVNALGLWLMFVVVITSFGLGMNALRPRLLGATRLWASVLLAAMLTSCAELGAQVWSLQWHQQTGIYSALLALQCVVLEQNKFFQLNWRDRLRVYGLFGVAMVGLSLLREFIGYGTLGHHLSWLLVTTQAQWQGWVLTADGGLRLATLAPGGFILLGLLIAAWQAWHRPPPSH